MAQSTCGKCNAVVTLDAAACPACGFVFGIPERSAPRQAEAMGATRQLPIPMRVVLLVVSLAMRAGWLLVVAYAVFILAFGTAGARQGEALVVLLLASVLVPVFAAPALVPMATLRSHTRDVFGWAAGGGLIIGGGYALMVILK